MMLRDEDSEVIDLYPNPCTGIYEISEMIYPEESREIVHAVLGSRDLGRHAVSLGKFSVPALLTGFCFNSVPLMSLGMLFGCGAGASFAFSAIYGIRAYSLVRGLGDKMKEDRLQFDRVTNYQNEKVFK